MRRKLKTHRKLMGDGRTVFPWDPCGDQLAKYNNSHEQRDRYVSTNPCTCLMAHAALNFIVCTFQDRREIRYFPTKAAIDRSESLE